MDSSILVPLDGTPLAERAVGYAAHLARAASARLLLIRSVPLGPVHTLSDAESEIRAQEDAEAYLDAIRKGLPTPGEIDIAAFFGDADATILDEARTHHASLIVMSTHARSSARRVIEGSIADEVARSATVPVLLVSPTCDRTWPTDRPLRVLLPLDGSPRAESALAAATALAEVTDVELVLLRVVDESQPIRIERTPNALPDVASDERWPHADIYLEQAARKLGQQGLQVTTVVDTGNPVTAVLSAVDAENIDLIAIASHGRGGITRLILGSVATAIVQHATVPVLCIGPEAMKESPEWRLASSQPRRGVTDAVPIPITPTQRPTAPH